MCYGQRGATMRYASHRRSNIENDGRLDADAMGQLQAWTRQPSRTWHAEK